MTDARKQGSDELYRLLVESAKEYAIFMIGLDGCVASWNSGAERIFGYSEDEAVGLPMAELFTADDREAGVPAAELEKAAREGQASDDRWQRRKDGSHFFASGMTEALTGDDGRMLRYVKVLRDNTERKRAEEALRRSEERYRTLFEAMDEAYAVVEAIADDEKNWVDFVFLEANPAFVKHTGMKNAVGRTATDLMGTPNPRWAQVYGQIAESGEPMRFEEQELTLGRTFDLYAFRLGGPESRRVAVLFSDITERKEAEEELRQLNESLEERVKERTEEVRTLASQVLLAEQRERKRVARLLHDDVQQTLHALNIRLDHLASRRGIPRDDEDLAGAITLLRSAVDGTRSLSTTIDPPVLRHGGLAEALRWLVGHMREWHDLSVDVELDLDALEEPDELRRSLVFHSVRELLFNVVKHAGVKRARIAARLDEDELVVEVSDEGMGFDVREALAQEPTGFGLATIRERLRFHGGDLKIDSAPGKGARKTLRIPVASQR